MPSSLFADRCLAANILRNSTPCVWSSNQLSVHTANRESRMFPYDRAASLSEEGFLLVLT